VLEFGCPNAAPAMAMEHQPNAAPAMEHQPNAAPAMEHQHQQKDDSAVASPIGFEALLASSEARLTSLVSPW
jgi:hypothetical protein